MKLLGYILGIKIMKKFILCTLLIIPLFGMEKDSEDSNESKLSLSKSEISCFDLASFGDLSEQLETLKVSPSAPSSPLSPEDEKKSRRRLLRQRLTLYRARRSLCTSPQEDNPSHSKRSREKLSESVSFDDSPTSPTKKLKDQY